VPERPEISRTAATWQACWHCIEWRTLFGAHEHTDLHDAAHRGMLSRLVDTDDGLVVHVYYKQKGGIVS
jgi:hypothetical protein